MTDIVVRNQQRRLKVNIRLLRELAERALSIITDCRERSSPRSTWPRSPERVRGKGFAPRRSRAGGGQPFGLPALQGLSIVLVSDETIAELNERFHHSHGPTDILTFEYDGLGELIISTERAVAHAKRYRTTPGRELALYVVHGILHLHGYDDRTPRQRARVRAAERRFLARLGRTLDLRKIVLGK
jgi:rRNA maturation RNase YbeY